MTDEESFVAGVMFALRHYERHTTGQPAFTLVDVDPAQWWSEVILTPKPKYLSKSQAHYEARLARWEVLAREYLRGEP